MSVLLAFAGPRIRPFAGIRLISVVLLAASLLPWGVAAPPSQKDKSGDRPALPYSMMGIRREDMDAYDSKGEPVAAATSAVLALNRTGWQLIRKYFPALGTSSNEQRVHPEDPLDSRYFANDISDDASASPMPLLCIVWSAPESELSGKLKALHDELTTSMILVDYSAWKLEDLRKAIEGMTTSAQTAQGVKYRLPKNNLSFAQALRLYQMTISLLRRETKWVDKADSPPPDMNDFSNRLSGQMPRQISDGGTVAMFLYRPGVFNHPLAKEEFEERADVVVIKRKGAMFDVEQFPVYLTTNQREWNPSWIAPHDEIVDSSLLARKFEHDWTRLDGPYLWYRPDLLSGEVTYRGQAKLQGEAIEIEAERIIESRGAVKRMDRPADYNPARITPFVAGVDARATGLDLFMVDPPRVDDQANNLKRLGPYFSNGFHAWCRYGRWDSGLAADNRTWVSVPADEPRSGSPAAVPSLPQTASGEATSAKP